MRYNVPEIPRTIVGSHASNEEIIILREPNNENKKSLRVINGVKLIPMETEKNTLDVNSCMEEDQLLESCINRGGFIKNNIYQPPK